MARSLSKSVPNCPPEYLGGSACSVNPILKGNFRAQLYYYFSRLQTIHIKDFSYPRAVCPVKTDCSEHVKMKD